MYPSLRKLSVIVVLLLISAQLSALPRFALRTGVRCQSCHINPTGAGMRSEYGSKQYGRDILPMEAFKEAAALEEFEPKLNETFSIGSDIRTLFQWLSVDRSSSFFEMEGNLTLNARLNKFLSFYLDKGLYQGFQVFGLFHFPETIGLKVGKFLPAFGIRVDDHTAYHRQGVPGVLDMPFGSSGEDTGIEASYGPDHFLFTAGIFNGVSGGSGGIATAGFGRKDKAYVVRGEYINRFGDVGINLGGSYYTNKNFNQEYHRLNIAGIFGGIDLFKTITVQAEMDAIGYEPLASGISTKGRIVYIEGNVLVTSGVDLKIQYDFVDPNLDVKSGTSSRIGVGAELFILSGCEVRPEYRISTNLSGTKTRNFLTQFHFYL